MIRFIPLAATLLSLRVHATKSVPRVAKWGERQFSIAPKPIDTSKCKEYDECKNGGAWLFAPGGHRECRYPAAELCTITCGTCGDYEVAYKCQTPVNAQTPPALRGNNVDWKQYFEGMLARYGGDARLLSTETPWLAEFPTFLSPKEADLLIEAAERTGFEEEEMPKHIRDVWKIDCESAECLRDPFVNEVYRRVGALLDIPMNSFESLEFLRYGKGQHYKPHMDSYTGVEPAGLRILTVFFYLTDVEEGGHTEFPKAEPKKLIVKPTKGKVVVWANTFSDMYLHNDAATHTAIPVRKGVKYAANFWVHPSNYRAAEHGAGPMCRQED